MVKNLLTFCFKQSVRKNNLYRVLFISLNDTFLLLIFEKVRVCVSGVCVVCVLCVVCVVCVVCGVSFLKKVWL